MTTTTPPTVNRDMTLRALRLLAGDAVVELRMLGPSKFDIAGGYYDADHREDFVRAVERLSGRGYAAYVTLNRVDRRCLARAANRMKDKAGQTTSDSDITRRTRLGLDFDPVRPAGVSSTEAELRAALSTATEVRTHLRELGWPEPIYGTSGNGGSLVYAVDLPNDNEATELVKRVLAALAERFSNETVKVDESVFNASRIWRLFGTPNVKGDSTDDQPHRLAAILDAPEELTAVPRELLEALADTAAKPTAGDWRLVEGGGGDFRVAAWIEKHGIEVVGPFDWNGGQRWKLPVCPWNDAHQNDAWIGQRRDGPIVAGCPHDGCKGKGWRDLRAIHEPGGTLVQRNGHAPAVNGIHAIGVDRPDGPSGSAPQIISADALLRQVFPPVKAIVPNLLAEGLMIFAGRAKLGKSWIALNLAVAVSSGGRALGTIDIPEAGDVLLMCLEDGPRRLQTRLRAVLRDDPAPTRLSIVTKWPRTDEGGVEHLERWLADHPEARMVLIDTAKRVKPRGRGNRPIYDEDYESLEALADLAKKHGVCIVVIHHTRKQDAEDPLDLISGSTGLTGAADGAMVLRRARGSSDAELVVVSRDFEDRELALRWDSIASTWMIAGEAAEARLSIERQAILRTLKAAPEPMSPREVADVTGQKYGAIKKLMWQMSQEGGREGRLYVAKGKYSVSPILTVIRGNLGNSNNSGNSGNPGNPSGAKAGEASSVLSQASPPGARGLPGLPLEREVSNPELDEIEPSNTVGLPELPELPRNGSRPAVKDSDRWATPPEVFDPLHEEFDFSLDACAEPSTAKVPHYFTPEMDGLTQSWAGETVWLNPPYSRPAPWLEKAVMESRTNGATVVALVKNDPSVKAWWHKWIEGKAAEVRVLSDRVRFLRPDGTREGSPNFTSAVVIYRPANPTKSCARCGAALNEAQACSACQLRWCWKCHNPANYRTGICGHCPARTTRRHKREAKP